MKHPPYAPPFLCLALLTLSTLACGVLPSRPEVPPFEELPPMEVTGPPPAPPTEESEEPAAPPAGDSESDVAFPLPDDAQNVVGNGTGPVNFQTSLSLEETMAFYRQALVDQGLTERQGLTVTSDTTFSIVFDSWSDGRAVVVQGVDMGGSTNVNVRLEDV